MAATKCLPKGGSVRRAAGGLFGIAGVLIAGAAARRGQAPGGVPLPTNIALGLTDRRLLIFQLSETAEKVTALTHSVPLAHIVGAACEVGRTLGIKVAYIYVALSDGSKIAVEAASPHARNGQELGRALVAAIAPPARPGQAGQPDQRPEQPRPRAAAHRQVSW